MRLMWQQPVVADVHVRRRKAGRQTGELLQEQEKKRGQKRRKTHPDLEGEVAAVEEHDVAGQGVLAHPAPRPCPVPHPCLLLSPASLDLPPREEAQHVAAFSPHPSHSPQNPSPHPSLALSLSRPLLASLLAKTPPFSPSLHCSLPHGWQGKTDWCRQLDWSSAGSGPEKPGGVGGGR